MDVVAVGMKVLHCCRTCEMQDLIMQHRVFVRRQGSQHLAMCSAHCDMAKVCLVPSFMSTYCHNMCLCPILLTRRGTVSII